MDDQARTHLVVSMGRLCRRSVAGGEPSSFLYSTHQPPLWLGWLCSALREVSLIRPHDSWPKREETSSSGFRARNRANFPNWEKKMLRNCAQMVSMHLQHVTGRKIGCVVLWTPTNELKANDAMLLVYDIFIVASVPFVHRVLHICYISEYISAF